MATTMEIPPKIETLFETLDHQKTLLTKCTTLYQTLTTHFTTLTTTLTTKSQALDSSLQTLDSTLNTTLDSLTARQDSLPDLLSTLSAHVTSLHQSALADIAGPPPDSSAPLSDIMGALCRRMDSGGLMRVVVGRRKETTSLRGEMAGALRECVDKERFVCEAVREFLGMKREGMGGLTDKRWACSMIVGAVFAPEELREGKGKGEVRARKAVERAREIVREWREVAEKGEKDGGGGGRGMGPAEAAMFLQIVLGFGLEGMFDEEVYKGLMVEFCGRRDMAKLAVPIFGDKVADLIDELVKKGKEVEAVYFASESGLTERFQPASLLKSHLRSSKKNATDILKKGNHSSAATDEANNLEITSIKSVIKCVEDHKIEAEFSLENLRKRLTVLEKAKADKKKSYTTSFNKRTHSAGGPRSSGAPPPRPTKIPKLSTPYAPIIRRDPPVSRALSPVSRYLTPYSFPSQSTYDTGLTASAYVPSYVGSHITPSDQITQPHYTIQADPNDGAGARLASSYGSQISYASYDYGAASSQTYPPPSSQTYPPPSSQTYPPPSLQTYPPPSSYTQ